MHIPRDLTLEVDILRTDLKFGAENFSRLVISAIYNDRNSRISQDFYTCQ